MDYVHPAKVDFVLFYAELTIQEDESQHCLSVHTPGAMVFFHNSNSAHRPIREVVDSLIGERVLDKPMLLPTPRGLAIC
jgi:hypothetical protein